MQDSITLVLIHNAALLITLAYVYSLLPAYENKYTPLSVKIILGGVVSAITLSVMLTSLEMDPGIVFDTRSVLMAGSGLFLGLIPTCMAMLTAGFFSLVIAGDAGVITGVSIIAVSGLVGLIWRHFRLSHLVDISWRELYVFGWAVHLALLPLFFLLPDREMARTIVDRIWLPYLLLYPAATMLLGRMLSYRLERERAAAILRESEERYRSLFERNPAIMLITDPDSGKIMDANAAAAGFYGWSREELKQKSYSEISVPGTGPGHSLMCHEVASGGDRFVETYQGPITVDGSARLFHIIQDVTDKKKLEVQLRQAQKMEAVGRLAGGVAHDYNNKLQAVLGFTEMAIREVEAESTLHKYLQEIETAASRSAQLTMQLMAFGRKQPIHPCVLDLNETIGPMLKMLKKLVGEDIDLVWKPEETLWPVMIDPSQVDQMLVNLAINARDATPDTGKLTIETHNVVVDEDYALLAPDSKPGDYVMVAVTDTGVGIAPEALEHLFEPFFTTKSRSDGSGLGLPTVYGILQQNGGFVHVQSTLGEGSSFKLYLPRTHAGEAVRKEPVAAAPAPAGRGETILVVEDEKLVLDLVKIALERAGYQVLTAADPQAALDLMAARREPIDLLVTDVVMPGMNGRVLSEKLAEQQPGLKVIFMSGYTEDAIVHRGLLEEGIHFIQKPFRSLALCNKVRQVLDAPSGGAA